MTAHAAGDRRPEARRINVKTFSPARTAWPVMDTFCELDAALRSSARACGFGQHCQYRVSIEATPGGGRGRRRPLRGRVDPLCCICGGIVRPPSGIARWRVGWSGRRLGGRVTVGVLLAAWDSALVVQ